jgi:hypothetical protein
VIGRWVEIDIDDALELLGPSFDSPGVRSYAVERLRKADDKELLLYLLQLVQALKYEHISTGASQGSTQDSSLAKFLIGRAASNFMLGSYFHWYLMVECEDYDPNQAVDNRDIYRKVAYDFMVEIERRPGGSADRKTLLRQAELIQILSKIATEVKASGESVAKKVDRVKHFLADPKNELISIDPPLPMPLDPSILITGVVPDQVLVFKRIAVEQALVRCAAHGDHFIHPQAEGVGKLLEHHANALRAPLRGLLPDVLVFQQHLTVSRFAEPIGAAQQAGLAAAVGPDQPDELTGVHVQAGVTQLELVMTVLVAWWGPGEGGEVE